jgi:hypothetical protein
VKAAWRDVIDLDGVACMRAVIVLSPMVLLAVISGEELWLRALWSPSPPLSPWSAPDWRRWGPSSRSDSFPLTFRHFRIFGTCFCSKHGEFNAFKLAARLHLYWRLSKV